MSRNLDLYAVERRAGHVVFILALWIVQHSILGRYWVRDVRDRVRKIGAQR